MRGFLKAFARASGNYTNEEIERIYSINYLKTHLGKLIDGNTDFWERFYRDFDVASCAFSIQAMASFKGAAPRKVTVLTHAEKQKLGL